LKWLLEKWQLRRHFPFFVQLSWLAFANLPADCEILRERKDTGLAGFARQTSFFSLNLFFEGDEQK